jgi:uncharacterized membrane protein
MIELAISGLLWLAALGCGVIAGVFFAFSSFVMAALERAGQVPGILAMNAINETILRSWFMPIFLGSTLASLLLAALSLGRWQQPGATALLAGGILYVLGMFACTMLFNVPLNNALAAVDPASPGGATAWAHHLNAWTRWNHVRTVASLIATALFIGALVARARS